MSFEKICKTAIYPQMPYALAPESFAGILRTSYPDWPGWNEIEKAKKETSFPDALKAIESDLQEKANAHYRRNFYNELKIDQIEDESIALELFEGGCTVGRTLAVRTLQHAFNMVINPEWEVKTTEDGIMSERFVNRLNEFENKKYLRMTYTISMGAIYISNKPFFRQWVKNR